MNNSNLRYTLLSAFIFLIISNVKAQNDITRIVSNSEKAVFIIKSYNSNGEQDKFGTGFFIDDKGTCVSNYHIIENFSKIVVTTIDGKDYEIKNIIRYSKEHDIIRFQIVTKDITPFLKINKTIPNKGEKIITIGNPEGLTWSASDGIISSIRPTALGIILQITAPISQGNSGSPVLNAKGEVIGIASFLLKQGQNLNFALHIGIIDSIRSNNIVNTKITSNKIDIKDFDETKSIIDSLITKIRTEGFKDQSKEKILTYIENFIKKFPRSPSGHIAMGDFLDLDLERIKAYESYSKAIQTDPKNPECYKKRGNYVTYNYYAFSEDQRNEIVLTAINDFKTLGNLSEKDLVKSYQQIGNCYSRLEDSKKEIEYLTKYINLAEKGADLSSDYVNRGLAYWKLKNYNEAQSDLNKAIQIKSNCYTKGWMVEFLLDYEKFAEASKFLSDECLETYEDFYNKSKILIEIDGDLNKAKLCINRSISIAQDYVNKNIMEKQELEKYLRLRAYINDKTKQPAEVLNDLMRILEINPTLQTDLDFMLWVIETKGDMKDYLGMLKEINRTIEKHADKPEIYYFKGYSLSKLNDYIGAIKAYTKAIELDPKNASYYYFRAFPKLLSNDKGGACSDWSKAGELGDFDAYERIKEYCN